MLAAVGLRQRLHDWPTPLGQTDGVEVAARLQQMAPAGQICISETTHRLVAGYCTTQPLGALSLKGKGKAEPVSAWDVLAVDETRTRLEVEAERGLTPFTGREPELRLLHECFAQAQAGHGQVVFLVGEAGLGKSRLLLEFRQRLGSEATWLEGHAMSFGRSFAFHPMIDLLRRNFYIMEARALAEMGRASVRDHNFDRGLAEAYQAIEIAREVDAKPIIAGGYYTSVSLHTAMGRLDKGEEEIDLVLTISRAGSDVVHQSYALTSAGRLKNWRGECAEASPLQAEGLRLAREHNLLLPLLFGCFHSGLGLTGKGEYDEALARLEGG